VPTAARRIEARPPRLISIRGGTRFEAYPRLMMPSDVPPSDHDPELSRFLDGVVALSADRHARGPEAHLTAVQELADEYTLLRKYRSERVLGDRFLAFTDKRFDLVDDPSEYALASDEVMVLSMLLGDDVPLAFPALKQALQRLSAVIGEEGVPAAFKQLLRRLRQLARQHHDAEIEAWVAGVIRALPGD
jgi:hypothetical protein